VHVLAATRQGQRHGRHAERAEEKREAKVTRSNVGHSRDAGSENARVVWASKRGSVASMHRKKRSREARSNAGTLKTG
jgi:hypothetical protein